MMWMEESGASTSAEMVSFEDDNSASAVKDIIPEEHFNADYAAAASGGGASANTQCMDSKIRISILSLQSETKDYLQNNLDKLEEILMLSSEEIKDETYDKEGKKRVRFNQAERGKLTLLWRWMEENRGDGQEFKFNWGDFNKGSFNAFVLKVDGIILDEVLEELKLSEEVKETLKGNGVHTPASFVEKSKYWYENEIKLSSADINEIEKFKKWYKYQLDTYLPSDWIVSFRKEAAQVKELRWRKVLKAIGLKADAIQALEINDVCDFATLNHTSKKWKISEPSSKKLRDDVSSSDSTGTNPLSITEKWDEWQKMGLKESDARHIINFRHWHKFYVARKNNKSDWAADFNSAQYERFVQRYIDPSKLDDFKKPGWWASRNDNLKPAQEKQDYYDILQAAAEDGNLTKQDRNRLREHYQDRREKMELIQEINEGVGDRSFQEKRLGEIFEEEAAIDNERKKQDNVVYQKCSQFFISSVLSVALLWCWGITTAIFIAEDIVEDHISPKGMKFAKDYGIFVNNITFGLVTAVAVQEIGEKDTEASIYNRFQPIYREYMDRLEKKIRSEKNRSQAWLMLKKLPMKFVLFSAHYYTYYWIATGLCTLLYGICFEFKQDSPLYSSGQTWAGVAVTVTYSHFGLKGKEAPKNDDAKDAIDHAVGGGDGAIGGEEAKFTDERGETKVVKTRHGLMNEIDRYEGLREKAEDERKFQDAADYQKCFEQLEQLQQLLPSVAELELQLKEVEEEMRAATDRKDYVNAEKLIKEVIKLSKKLEDEKDAVANGDVSSS